MIILDFTPIFIKPEQLQQFKKYILITKKGIDIFFWVFLLVRNAAGKCGFINLNGDIYIYIYFFIFFKILVFFKILGKTNVQ